MSPNGRHDDGSSGPSARGRIAALTVLAALLVGACSAPAPPGTPHTAASTATQPAGPTFVELPGPRVSYACANLPAAGSGGATVVLLAGLDTEMTIWELTRLELGAVPVCTYDRANLGKSDLVPGPRLFTASVEELDEFLEAAKVPPPYLLVGHSYGGLVAMLYAARHPENVHSLLLVDALLPFEDDLDELSKPAAEVQAGRKELNSNREQLTIYGKLPDSEDVASSLPAVPIVYLFGRLQDLTEPGWPAGAYLRRMRAFINSLPNGKIVEVNAGHGIPLEDPAAIAREVHAIR